MNAHFHTFPSLCPLQSAYRKFHSTETALLRIYNDLLRASDRRQVTALVLLDLSSAFDTIDHQILLDRLASFYGFSGLALSLLRSYLSDHHVVVQSSSSPAFHITTGVPQGSVLGPLLFSLYTSIRHSLKILIFIFTYMPMILNFISPFQALILLYLLHLYLMPLILFTHVYFKIY